LFWLVPVAIGLIFFLLYVTLKSFRLVMMVLSAIPLAVTGGIFTLWLRGMPFSIPAGIGFIALFGIAVLNGIVLISFFEELKGQRQGDRRERIVEGSRMRLRPVLLTALTDILGFLPMAVSTSAGAEIQRPLATVVVGGLFTSTLLTLMILPVLYSYFGQGSSSSGNGGRSQGAIATGALLLLIALPQMGRGQSDSILTPQEAVDSAWARHPSIRAAELRIEENEALKRSAYHIGPTYLYRGRAEWPYEGTPGVQNRFGVQQQVEFPLTMQAEAAYYEARKDEADAALQLRKARIERRVLQAYSELAYRIEIRELWERSARVHREVLKAAKARFRTGDIGRLERTSLKAKVRRIRTKLREARAQEGIQRKELARQLYMEDSLEAGIDSLRPLADPSMEGEPPSGHPLLQKQ
jgi:cobalt-zinc-cadmium resistance protein CzcA